MQRSAFAGHRQESLSAPARLFLLLLILLAGAFFRFHHLTRYEPFIADEAAYHLEARYLYSLASHSLESLRLKLLERKTGQDLVTREQVLKSLTEDLDGRPPWYARPLHTCFIALGMTLWKPESVWLGGLVSAVFGTLSILLVYGLGTTLFGAGAGLLAAALFSLCGYQVAYCHTGLTEQDSLFFLLLAGLFQVLGKDRQGSGRGMFLLFTGLSLGTCFVTHYRMLASILVFFVWEAFFQSWPELEVRRERIRKRIACMSILASGMALPIVLMEFPYYLLTLFFHRFLGAIPPFQTYFEQLAVQVLVSIYTNLRSTREAFGLSNLLTYPYLLWKLAGPLAPLALTGAVVFSIRRRRRSDLWVLLLFAVPFVLCTLLQPRARYGCGFLAFGSLLVASALCASGQDTGVRRRAARPGPLRSAGPDSSPGALRSGTAASPAPNPGGSSLTALCSRLSRRFRQGLARKLATARRPSSSGPAEPDPCPGYPPGPAGSRDPGTEQPAGSPDPAPREPAGGPEPATAEPARGLPVRVGPLFRGVLIAALLLCGAVYSWKAGQPRLSYAHAMDFLRSRGTLKHLSTYPLVSQVYAGVDQVPSDWPPPTEEELRGIYRNGTRYLLVDAFQDLASFLLHQVALDTKPGFQERLRLLERLEGSLRPAFVTENLHLEPIQNIFEVNHNFLQTLSCYRRMAEIPRVRTIRVYDLREMFGEVPRQEGANTLKPARASIAPAVE